MHAISSVLQSPKDLELEETKVENMLKKSSSLDEELTQNNARTSLVLEAYEVNRVKNFWFAYESLTGKTLEKIEAGTNLAIEMQIKTMTEGNKLSPIMNKFSNLFD